MSTGRFINPSVFGPVYIARKGIAEGLKDAAKRYAKGKLIDLGCGIKPYKELFAPYCDSYFGVDSPDVAKFNYGEDTVADLWADCTETGLDGDCFDTILSTQVLEHIEHPQKLLREAHRLLKRGGILIMTTAFFGKNIQRRMIIIDFHNMACEVLWKKLVLRFSKYAD